MLDYWSNFNSMTVSELSTVLHLVFFQGFQEHLGFLPKKTDAHLACAVVPSSQSCSFDSFLNAHNVKRASATDARRTGWLLLSRRGSIMASRQKKSRLTDSLIHLTFFFCPKSKSRKLTFVESYQLIDHAKQMQAVDRAHHWNHSSWNPWLRDYVEIWLGYVMLPNSNFLSQQRYALVFWCFKQRVSLLGIPKCCPSSTTFVSAASLHH